MVWRLSKNGSGYKVRDAKVMGFSLIYLQRGLFTSFLSKRNGDVEQLVAALNQARAASLLLDRLRRS